MVRRHLASYINDTLWYFFFKKSLRRKYAVTKTKIRRQSLSLNLVSYHPSCFLEQMLFLLLEVRERPLFIAEFPRFHMRRSNLCFAHAAVGFMDTFPHLVLVLLLAVNIFPDFLVTARTAFLDVGGNNLQLFFFLRLSSIKKQLGTRSEIQFPWTR